MLARAFFAMSIMFDVSMSAAKFASAGADVGAALCYCSLEQKTPEYPALF